MRYEELEKMYRLEDRYWWFVGRRRLVRALLRRYAPAAARVLDVGCGTGGTMDALAGCGEVFGADISNAALALCRERGHALLIQSRAEGLACRDACFDATTCCDILEHLEDDAAGFAEIARVLGPGGSAIITVPAYQWLWSEHDEALSHKRRYGKRELRGRIEAAGLRIRKLTYAVSLVFPMVLLIRLAGRLRVRKLGAPHTQLMSLPGWLNALLTLLGDIEVWVISRFGFPFGASLVAVVERPGEDEATS